MHEVSRRRLLGNLGIGAAVAAFSAIGRDALAQGNGAPPAPAFSPLNTLALAAASRAAAIAGADWLEAQIDPVTGSFGADAFDLAAYYKAAAAMHLVGRPRLAYKLLDFIASSFLQPDGDLLTAPGLRTNDPVLSQYPGYMNGWVILGAQRSGRFDVSRRAYDFFRGYQDPASGASVLVGPYFSGTTSQRELLMTAHLGVNALYMGEMDIAEAAGWALVDFYDIQPDPNERIYLRTDATGALVTSFPPEIAGLCVVEASQTGQSWFFVGYPIAYLTLLHQATGEARFLKYARKYAEFALRCGTRLTSEHYGHKVGWGAALLARATGKKRYRKLAEAVAQSLLATQAPDGGWLPGQARVTRLDQSAEVVQWLLEIGSLLDPAQNG
jgi:hypothetical protein